MDDLGKIEKSFIDHLEGLTGDIETYFKKLAEVEEPLQKPFAAEVLTKIQLQKTGTSTPPKEILLKDSISKFRALREEKEQFLRKLWTEWEDIQFELIQLAAEVLKNESVCVSQRQMESITPNQQQRLEEIFKRSKNDGHLDVAVFQQDLKGFDNQMRQISNSTKKAAHDMQEVCITPSVTMFMLSLLSSQLMHQEGPRSSSSPTSFNTSKKTEERPGVDAGRAVFRPC